MSIIISNRFQFPKGQKPQGQQSPTCDCVQERPRVSEDPEPETQEHMKTRSEGVPGN